MVKISETLAFEDFPKVNDILAIARIESTFKPGAKNGISNGLMQVNRGPFEVEKNLQAGVKLLREYYLMLGSVKAAVIAYNVGPGNYRKGRFRQEYWNKYLVQTRHYASWYVEYSEEKVLSILEDRPRKNFGPSIVAKVH